MSERMKLRTDLIEGFLQKNERSQAWLARSIGVHPATVTTMLDGKVPQAQTVIRLATLLDVTVEELLVPSGQRTA